MSGEWPDLGMVRTPLRKMACWHPGQADPSLGAKQSQLHPELLKTAGLCLLTWAGASAHARAPLRQPHVLYLCAGRPLSVPQNSSRTITQVGQFSECWPKPKPVTVSWSRAAEGCMCSCQKRNCCAAENHVLQPPSDGWRPGAHTLETSPSPGRQVLWVGWLRPGS